MNRRTQIGLGLALLAVSSLIVLYASVAPTSTVILGAIGVASLGLAAGALLVGTSSSSGRPI